MIRLVVWIRLILQPESIPGRSNFWAGLKMDSGEREADPNMLTIKSAQARRQNMLLWLG